MNRLELAAIDLGVNLGRGDGGVAEHLLDDTEIGASRQQMGCKGVAQLMRVDGLLNPRDFRVMAD